MSKAKKSLLTAEQLNHGLMAFIQEAPTPFHAVASMAKRLQQAGYESLDESQAWRLQPGGRYYVTRNASSLIAFTLGQAPVVDAGLRVIGAHTDSPGLKLKPQAIQVKKGFLQLGVEVYGGALLNPWFDRDLSLAGRVTYKTQAHAIKSTLIDFKDPVAVIPSLAIHLDREVNQKRSINAQTDIMPIMALMKEDAELDIKSILMERLRQEQPASAATEILDFEIFLYDTQPPAQVGLQHDFIAAARLDNLLSCYLGLMSLLQAGKEHSCMLVCKDHEEVGSMSAAGAHGSFLRSVLERIMGTGEAIHRGVARSWLISADNAHSVHPNYANKHDPQHSVILNQGPVIKINANQRYASTSESAAMFRHLCQSIAVPVQSFVMRSDLACGSTIGPITASELGIKTVDAGVPTLAMHSLRELAGCRDLSYFYQVLVEFFCRPELAGSSA